MISWPKILLALAAPLLLNGCLWGPGKFASDLTLKKDGSFVLDSVGDGGCRIQVAIKPMGGLTFVTVRYGAACPEG